MKKNILIMMKFLKGGGAEQVLLTILNQLNTEMYNITLFLVFNEGIYLNKVPKNVQLKYIFTEETHENNEMIKYHSKEIYQNYIKDKYDIEIAFLEGVSTKILAESTQNSKKIAWLHVDLYDCHYTQEFYESNKEEELVYKKFDQIIFVSRKVQNQFYKLFPALIGKGLVLYNPIDIEKIKELSKTHQVKYDKFTFISIGRLTKQKGFDRLIDSAFKLRQMGYDFQVVILGEGPDYAKLKSQIEYLKLDDVISLEGFKANPYPYLLASDIFISSSRSEGLALVLCEAMILKKKIIATNCSGVIEALANGEYGLIVENSESGIYNGMLKALKNEIHYNIPDKAVEKFELKNTIKLIESIF